MLDGDVDATAPTCRRVDMSERAGLELANVAGAFNCGRRPVFITCCERPVSGYDGG
jgi:hypothetical protein